MAAALQPLSTFSVTNRCYFCPTLPMHLLLRVHDDDDDDDKGVTRRQSPPLASSWSVVSCGLRSSSLLWNSFEGQHEVSLLPSEEMRFASKCFGTWRITTNHLVVCDDGVFLIPKVQRLTKVRCLNRDHISNTCRKRRCLRSWRCWTASWEGGGTAAIDLLVRLESDWVNCHPHNVCR